jgi:hypothetical protein
MKINYNKNDLVPINLDEEETKMYARIFCCKLGSFLLNIRGGGGSPPSRETEERGYPTSG